MLSSKEVLKNALVNITGMFLTMPGVKALQKAEDGHSITLTMDGESGPRQIEAYPVEYGYFGLDDLGDVGEILIEIYGDDLELFRIYCGLHTIVSKEKTEEQRFSIWEIRDVIEAIEDDLLKLDINPQGSESTDGIKVTLNDMLIDPGSPDHSQPLTVGRSWVDKISMMVKLSDITDDLSKEMLYLTILYLALEEKISNDRSKFGVDNAIFIKRERYFDNRFARIMRKLGPLKIIAKQRGISI